MPIYQYLCSACGELTEVLQKFSDEPLKICPECGKAELRKQLTAPAFKLKGSGWYVTDFRDSGKEKGGDKSAAPGQPTAGADNSAKKPAAESTSKKSTPAKPAD